MLRLTYNRWASSFALRINYCTAPIILCGRRDSIVLRCRCASAMPHAPLGCCDAWRLRVRLHGGAACEMCRGDIRKTLTLIIKTIEKFIRENVSKFRQKIWITRSVKNDLSKIIRTNTQSFCKRCWHRRVTQRSEKFRASLDHLLIFFFHFSSLSFTEEVICGTTKILSAFRFFETGERWYPWLVPKTNREASMKSISWKWLSRIDVFSPKYVSGPFLGTGVLSMEVFDRWLATFEAIRIGITVRKN